MIEFQSEKGFTFLDFILIIFILFGVIKFLLWVISLFGFCGKHCCRQRLQTETRLYDRYGLLLQTLQSERSWAVITGGSDGIGFEMALKCAKQYNFNICIISRNKQKMITKLQEIETEVPGISTKYVVADFEKMNKISDYQKIIGKALKGMDIGVLVLNAGFMELGPFEWVSNECIEKHVMINVLHEIYTAKVLCSQMVQRFDKRKGQKSAMIFVSSGLGQLPVAGCIAYSASKGFMSYLSQGLSVEFEGKIDCLSFNSGLVKTKFIDGMDEKMKNNKNMCIEPSRSAEVAFRDIGVAPTTGGDIRHDMPKPPQNYFSKYFYKMSLVEFEKMYPNDERFTENKITERTETETELVKQSTK